MQQGQAGGGRFEAAVEVHYKDGVLDPQGQAVAGALRALGHAQVQDVRVGRHIVLRLGAADAAAATAAVEAMCRELLANPVLETFRFTVRPLPADGGPDGDAVGAAPAAGGGGR